MCQCPPLRVGAGLAWPVCADPTFGLRLLSNIPPPSPPLAATTRRRPPRPFPRPGRPRRTRPPTHLPCGRWNCRAASPERSPAAPPLPAIRRAVRRGRRAGSAFVRWRVVPGWMQLTVIHYGPVGLPIVFVMCTKPALRAPPLRLPALRALPPLLLMMRPQAAILHERNDRAGTAQRSDILHIEILDQILLDNGFDRAGRGGRAPRADPLLTMMCRPPSCSAASATMRSTCSLLVTSPCEGNDAPVCLGSQLPPVASRSALFAPRSPHLPLREPIHARSLCRCPRLPPSHDPCLSCKPRSMAFSPLSERPRFWCSPGLIVLFERTRARVAGGGDVSHRTTISPQSRADQGRSR